MNHILFFVYAVGRKHTCIDNNLTGLWFVELELSFVIVSVVGGVISCSPANPQMSDSHQQRVPDQSYV